MTTRNSGLHDPLVKVHSTWFAGMAVVSFMTSARVRDKLGRGKVIRPSYPWWSVLEERVAVPLGALPGSLLASFPRFLGVLFRET